MAAATATAAVAGAAAEQSAGLPQFDVAQWPGQMVWMLIIFAVMFFLFALVFVPRIGGAMDRREDRIAGDIGDARRLKDQAETQAAQAAAETARARGRAHQLAEDAKARAKAEASTREAQEQAKLAETLGHAEAQITAARDEAMTHVGDIAAQTASAIVEKLTGKAATAAELSVGSRR
jgi:F-type H+-transporting ATPase subunit b